MTEKKKIKLALRLYPFYEAVSGDLLFFSVIQTLFFSRVKGFSAADIALLILITDVVDLAIEYPSYGVIRKLGNSRATVIGGILPLIGILFITFGQTLPLVIVGNIFFVSAGNFQSMAGAGARNNLVLLKQKEDYAKLFSRGNTIYSAVSMAAAVLIPIVFSINRYLPSVMCIFTCGVIAVCSFFIADYSEGGGGIPASEYGKGRQKKSLAGIGKGRWLLLIVFWLYFCAGAVFTSNTEVFLGNRLGEHFSEQETIYIYGMIIWLARMLRLGSNILLPRVLKWMKERIIILAALTLMIAFSTIGICGLLFGNTLVPVILAGIVYVLVKGLFWDPLRTFLRMSAVDTNNKKLQQSMLVLLNAGQSLVSVLMELAVVGILKVSRLEYVFSVFSVISGAAVFFSVLLTRELRKQKELLCYDTVLSEGEIDEISARVCQTFSEAGMPQGDIVSYRLLTEEKLIECIREGKAGESLQIRIYTKLDDYHIALKIGEEERDIFALPEDEDLVSHQIFRNITMRMNT